MRYKKLKGTDVELSSLTIGTWAIGGKNSAGGGYGDVDDIESIKAIRTLLDAGVNFIDTAPIYGSGGAERIVGEAIKTYPREDIYIATKFGSYISGFDGKAVRNNKYDYIMWEVQESLKNLQTDYIDFYLMHWPDVNTTIEETMCALMDLKEKGIIKYVGLCNSSRSLIEEAMKYGKVDVIQAPYSMVNQEDVDLMKWAESQGIAVMTWGSLGAGILTGTIREMPKFDDKDFRNTFYPFFKEPMFSNIMEYLKTMDIVADKYNKPLAQIALNWSTQKSFVTTAIAGVRNEAEAIENAATFEWSLEPKDVEFLDDDMKRLNIG